MNNENKQYSTLLISTIIVAVWCVIIFIACDLSWLRHLGWFGFIFVPLSFGIGYYCFTVSHRQLQREDAGSMAIPAYCTGVFLVLSVAINTIFLVLSLSNFVIILIIMDILLLVAYLSIMLYATACLSSLKNKGLKIDRKTISNAQISISLEELTALTQNTEEKAALLKLKETVDYSTNTSKRISESFEADMANQIKQLQSAILEKKETSLVIKLIADADMIWRRRNATMV
jgi:hypothetical protein